MYIFYIISTMPLAYELLLNICESVNEYRLPKFKASRLVFESKCFLRVQIQVTLSAFQQAFHS